jgi:drug/metabolite transporter (DMT)-like permease
MVASYYILKSRFKLMEIFAAVIIMAGTALAVVPIFTGDRQDSGSSHVTWYSVLLYALSQVPNATNNVLKEATLKHAVSN